MKIYTLESEMTVAVPLQEAFAFFEDPRNLARITPPELGFRITSREPVVMHRGAEIAYRIRVSGVPLGWKTRITGLPSARLAWHRARMKARSVMAIWLGPSAASEMPA